MLSLYSPFSSMHFPKCGGIPASASHWLNSCGLWWGSWPLTFLHNSESHFTNCAMNIWRVLHLAGECAIVSGLQIPDDDGNIITLNIPIPGDSLFKPCRRQFVGLLQVVEYLQEREEAVIPTHCCLCDGSSTWKWSGSGWGTWPELRTALLAQSLSDEC